MNVTALSEGSGWFLAMTIVVSQWLLNILRACLSAEQEACYLPAHSVCLTIYRLSIWRKVGIISSLQNLSYVEKSTCVC
jgi:hypothetical protein